MKKKHQKKRKNEKHKAPDFKDCWCSAAWFLPSLDGVAVFLHMFGGEATFPSSLLLGGAAWSPLGGVAFPISSQVVLPPLLRAGRLFSSPRRCCLGLHFSGWCCRFSCPFGGTTFPLSSVGVVLPSFPSFGMEAALALSSVGWCCSCPKSKRKDAKWKMENEKMEKWKNGKMKKNEEK